LVPASERAVRRWSVDLLLVDECARVDDELLLGAAFPTTAARPDPRIVLAGSLVAAEGAPGAQGTGSANKALTARFRGPLEALDVHLARRYRKHIARTARHDRARAQRLPQVGDVDLQALGGRHRRTLAPQRVDQAVG
jgi:hypothetical protein